MRADAVIFGRPSRGIRLLSLWQLHGKSSRFTDASCHAAVTVAAFPAVMRVPAAGCAGKFKFSLQTGVGRCTLMNEPVWFRIQAERGGKALRCIKVGGFRLSQKLRWHQAAFR